MKIEMVPTINLCDLENALFNEYQEDFDELAPVLWGNFYDDSYKSLYFRNFNDKSPREEKCFSLSNPEDVEKRNKVYAYLAKIIPEQYNKVLINIF